MFASETGLGKYEGVVYSFDESAHSSGRGVHTFSVTWNPAERTYFGYAGPVERGAVDVWTSEDGVRWRQHDRETVADYGDWRWPTAITEDGIIYLIVDRNTSHVRWRQGLRSLVTLNGQLPNPVASLSSRLELYESRDGIEFSYLDAVVTEEELGTPTIGNPFLFTDPTNGHVALVYHSQDENRWEIRYRSAESVPGLGSASDTVLRTDDELLAAPSMVYHPEQDSYYLFAEAVDEETGEWVTTMYQNESPTEEFQNSDETVIFSNGACPFPYVLDNRLFLFLSEANREARNGKISGNWTGKIHAFDLRADGR